MTKSIVDGFAVASLTPRLAPGDDIVSRPDGAIVWGNTIGGECRS